MRWEDERESSNVEDVRGDGGGGLGGGGFGGGGGGLGLLLGLLPLLGRRGGVVGLLVVAAIIFGPQLLHMGGGGAPTAPQPSQSAPAGAVATSSGDVDLTFVKKVVAYTEDSWGEIFREQGRTYTPPQVKVYSGSHVTGCGQGQAEMGPFYCPADRTVWLDLSFFGELSNRFGAPGRFAEAYVIAHEVGHHVQNLLGEMGGSGQAGLSGGDTRNEHSVRVELQADCYAGVWANRTNRDRQFLDPGDVEEGLKAASAVGDDTLQRETTGRVAPDSFTHGTSAQRVKWFRRGFDGGDMSRCDTFGERYDAL